MLVQWKLNSAVWMGSSHARTHAPPSLVQATQPEEAHES